MEALRTLHIDAEREWFGGQNQVAALCRHLRDAGHVVTVICQPDSAMERWAHKEGLAALAVRMRSSGDISAVFAIARHIMLLRPDIVHLHSSRAHVLGAAAARLAGFRNVVATRRNQDPVHMAWPNTSAYGRWVRRIVTVSEAVRDSLVEVGVDPGKITVIRSGVDTARFGSARPDEGFRRSNGIAEDVPIVLFAGGLTARKDPAALIDAAALISERCKLHLVFAGSGELQGDLVARVKAKGVAATFTGYVADTAPLLALCDVFVMPSISEGLGTAAIEAMAAGKPLIASAVGGLVESVIDGATGYLVPPADPTALADRLASLLTQPDLARKMGQEGQKRAINEFDISHMARLNEELYRELLQTR